MGNDRMAKYALNLILLVAVTLAPGTAWAGGNTYPGKNGKNPSAGDPAPIAAGAYPLGGAIVDPTFYGCSYTFPIQAVYQCPAVLADQPGHRVAYLRPNPVAGLLGGRPYLYHP